MKLIALSCLSLSLYGYLAASVIPASTVSGSSPKDWSLQSLSGLENGELSGSLLESLSGVTATGKGVIVGIIDSGIDWRHPDFRDPADSLRSRILSIWDSNWVKKMEGAQADVFDYGREWTREEIEAALRGEGSEPPRDTISLFGAGHGTFVAGIAAGNGNANPRYRGMAPESEIVVYSLGPYPRLGKDSSNLEGAHYIFDLAERKGLPAVVNISGSSLFTHRDREELESLLREAPGRALVAVAGNRGLGRPHARFDLTAVASYTIYRTRPRGDEPGSELVVDACHQGPGEAWVGVGLSENEMVWRSLDEIADDVTDSLGTARVSWSGSYTRDGYTPEPWTCQYQGAYKKSFSLRVHIEDSNPELAEWRVAARGSGVLHTYWSGRSLSSGEPLGDPQYRPSNNYYTLVSPGSFPEVITVGAFANRDLGFLGDRYLDLFDDLKIGDILPFSSRGPTLDGLIKPDLVAPGVLTAPFSGDSTKYLTATGTSASAPVVAGAVALYFERFPQATNREVWRALTESAASDEFTGETPNYDWGYGKLDVAAFLQEPPTVVAAEAGEVLPSGFSLAQNHPNPFNGRTTIAYELAEPGGVELTLYDLLGQPVRRLVSEYRGAGSHRVAWDGADDGGNQVASGVYLYRLKAGSRERARRLVLVR